MPGRLAPKFNSTTARAAALKSNAVRAAQAALKKRALNPPASPADSLSARIALEREGLLVLLHKERNKPHPDPKKVKVWLEAVGKVLEIERDVAKAERNGARAIHPRREARPMAEPVPSQAPESVKSESPPEQTPPEQPRTGALSDYPG